MLLISEAVRFKKMVSDADKSPRELVKCLQIAFYSVLKYYRHFPLNTFLALNSYETATHLA